MLRSCSSPRPSMLGEGKAGFGECSRFIHFLKFCSFLNIKREYTKYACRIKEYFALSMRMYTSSLQNLKAWLRVTIAWELNGRVLDKTIRWPSWGHVGWGKCEIYWYFCFLFDFLFLSSFCFLCILDLWLEAKLLRNTVLLNYVEARGQQKRFFMSPSCFTFKKQRSLPRKCLL